MSPSNERFDVVVVGAGIAGGALATAVARGGSSVLVLERSTEYVDRVRGEFMAPWGVAETQRLGVFDDLVATGANFNVRYVPYDEVYAPAEAEAVSVSIDTIVPGVPGAMGIGHPTACRTLDTSATNAGATVVHGAEVLEITAGASPLVRYVVDGVEHEVRCRLIVGADGRESFVRKSSGIELLRNEARMHMGGLLVEGVHDWPDPDFMFGTEGDRLVFAFPQGGGRVRLYLGFLAGDKKRLAGADKASDFLDAFRVSMIPDSERFSEATPAGPCAAFPMYDSWTESPTIDGVVLIGDAAGFSDPLIGQGLSVAMRDARSVADALASADDWSASAFVDYAAERSERMRRLRCCVATFTDAHIPLGPGQIDERRRRLGLVSGGDSDLFMLVAATLVGPELFPEASFSPAVRERLLTPA